MHIQEQGGTGSTRFYGFSGTGGDRSMHLLSVKYRRSNPEESAATGRIRGGGNLFRFKDCDGWDWFKVQGK